MEKINTNRFQITESIYGNFFYHISHIDNNTKSLCGKEIMPANMSFNQWGISTAHIKEKFCEKCKQYYNYRFHKNIKPYNTIEPCNDCGYCTQSGWFSPMECKINWYPENVGKEENEGCSKYLDWIEKQVIDEGYAGVSRRHGILYCTDIWRKRNPILSKIVSESILFKVLFYMSSTKLFWRYLKW